MFSIFNYDFRDQGEVSRAHRVVWRAEAQSGHLKVAQVERRLRQERQERQSRTARRFCRNKGTRANNFVQIANMNNVFGIVLKAASFFPVTEEGQRLL